MPNRWKFINKSLEKGIETAVLRLETFVRLAFLFALPACCMVGCARWKDFHDSSPISETQQKSAVRGLGERQRTLLEVDFVNTNMSSMDADQVAGLWQWVDETSIDAKLRQRLLDNGIRVGLLRNRERFQQRLDDVSIESSVIEEFLNEAAVASDVSHGQQRIPMRMGRRYELALRQPFEGSHVTLVRADDETIGRTLKNAQYFLTLTASQANSPQQIRLSIGPEVQYGNAKQKWVSSERAIRIDTRRETWSLEMLDIHLLAAQGDTIVIAPEMPANGLAKRMLTGTGNDQDPRQLVVLIHVLQIPSPADSVEKQLR